MNIKILLTLSVVFFMGCNQNLPINPREEAQAKRIGSEATTTVLRTMMMKLMTEVQSKGTIAAAEFCSVHAQELTGEIQQQLKKGITIKRISQKNRNAKNVPNSEEKEALAFFIEEIKRKKEVDSYLVKRKKEEKVVFHYYKPLFVAPLCLQCHGDPQKMNPKVVEAIKSKYPQDKAVGFKPGDFRGALKISIP